jgi:hypothetical protein
VKSLQVLATATLSLSPLLFAQKTPSTVTAACGDLQVGMAVHLDKAQHGLSQPDAGKALVYFIQDAGINGSTEETRIGIDGKWVGANTRRSSFAVLVDPGEHHLCASMGEEIFKGTPVTLAHLIAEPGKTYFYQTKVDYWKDVPAYLSLEPVDSDEAKFLIESNPLATATAKK